MKKKTEQLTPALESYLELILDLQKEYGAVRVTDLAEKMGCSLPSVTSALRRLAKHSLVFYETYRPVTLTADGEKLVKRLNNRHRILSDLFQNFLLIDPAIAETEACNLEHKISPEILNRFAAIRELLDAQPDAEELLTEFQKRFRQFLTRRTDRKNL